MTSVVRAVFFALAALLAACAAPVAPLPPAPPVELHQPVPIALPGDDAPHDLLTEWWYYTGHLRADQGQRYGFELVTFQAIRGDNPPVYVSHFAVTDRQRLQFRFDQRGQGSASGSRQLGFDLRLGGWSMRGSGGIDELRASMQDYGLELTTRPLKPAVMHDGDGYIDFGMAGGSYYYSRTRLEARGTLVDHGEQRTVTGEAWFDHQWGNFLVVGTGGWDWFSAHLDDGTDLTISLVRDDRGGVPLAYGTFVDERGEATHLSADSFTVEATGSWSSPRSGATYPMGWRVTLPDPALDLVLTPVLEDQELDTGATTGSTYWEGEVIVSGRAGPRPITGLGYVELTGYAR